MRWLLLYFLLTAGIKGQAQKIHLFFLADPADKFSPKDRQVLEAFWQSVGPYLDASVSVNTASNRADLLTAIRTASIEAGKDILVFYFSGRGEAASDKVWPIMKFRDGQETAMKDVLQVALTRKAHLSMIMADCDNLVVDEPVYVARMIPRPHPPVLRESCQQLYLGKSQGKRLIIKMSAASVGQRARRDKNGNSVFLAALINTLKEQMSQAKPLWIGPAAEISVKSRLMQTMADQTGGLQKPRFEMAWAGDPSEGDDNDVPSANDH